MFNIFKRKKSTGKADDKQKMGMLQRLAMKKMERMSPEERQKLMQKVMRPENISKHKDQILSTMEQMKASGQITDEQIALAKKQLGL